MWVDCSKSFNVLSTHPSISLSDVHPFFSSPSLSIRLTTLINIAVLTSYQTTIILDAHVPCYVLVIGPTRASSVANLSERGRRICQSKEKHELADSSAPRLPCNTKCTMSHVPKMKQKHSSEWKSAILKWKILTVHRLRVLVQVSRYPNLHFKTGLHSSVTP